MSAFSVCGEFSFLFLWLKAGWTIYVEPSAPYVSVRLDEVLIVDL